MIVPDRLRIDLPVDLAGLTADVAALPEEAWAAHFNTAIYQGDWSGVALRTSGTGARQLYPDPTATTFADTEILARCPHLSVALAGIACPMTSVRLLALGAGASIATHRDYQLGYCDGEVRLHVPVVTNPDVEFMLDGRAVHMGQGECWYLNLNLPHSVANRSTQRRVHLVVDCVVDAWLEQVFASALAARRAL